MGECALWGGKLFGLVAPGYQMAEAAADVLLGGDSKQFTGADMSTKLKLMGVDVASFGDPFDDHDDNHIVAFQEVIVPGGGVALVRASSALDNLKLSADPMAWFHRIHRSSRAPR